MILAGLGAVGVFVAVASYVSDVRSEVGDKVRVLRVARSVEALSPLDGSVVESVEIPDKWVPASAIRDRAQLRGQVAASDLPAGSLLQRGMVEPEPDLRPGERELAILVDAETGVAGKIGPGSVVDIEATFEGNDQEPAKSQIVVAGARVIDVGDQREAGSDGPDQQGERGEVVPVTFALSVRESLILTYAESFATEVRLAIVAPGEREVIPLQDRQFQLR